MLDREPQVGRLADGELDKRKNSVSGRILENEHQHQRTDQASMLSIGDGCLDYMELYTYCSSSHSFTAFIVFAIISSFENACPNASTNLPFGSIK